MRRPTKNRKQPQPDEVYGSFKVAKLINYVMERARRILRVRSCTK